VKKKEESEWKKTTEILTLFDCFSAKWPNTNDLSIINSEISFNN